MLIFVRDKIIIRSLVALPGPLIIYAGVVSVLWALDVSSTYYLSPIAWGIIICLSLFSPIGLVVTLWPIERFFDWMMKVDDTDNFALQGNYAPVHKDITHEIVPSLVKEGAIPLDINGVFLRNGPNPIFMPAHGRHHWFDGDGRIHGFRIKDGRAYYCTK